MINRYALLSFFMLLLVTFTFIQTNVYAQGVTTAAINGTIKDANGDVLPSANILALHTPSGTQYGTTSRLDGRYAIVGMRVGGPYTVTVSFVGYKSQVIENVSLSLGTTTDLNFSMQEEGIEIGEITVTAQRNNIISSERTGASISIDAKTLETLPTITRRLEDFTRLTPQAKGNYIGGQDNRLNNITVDGSYFNNSFGLAGQPGDRTNVSPISLDAIDQVQVNVAPFDVRQGNFTGAGINTVTKSGSNEFSGSVYYQFRHQGLVGTEAKDLAFNPGRFKYNQMGVRLGGPIVKNKLFFFASFEKDELTQPGTTFLANTGGQPVGGNITRVLASDLDQLRSYLNTNFGYETGPYQGYDFETPALKFLLKFDYNLNEKNKISLRYTHLDSETDVLLSNSASLGFGNRRSNLTGLNFANSNYMILENIRSVVGEWNSSIGENMANNLIVGYTYNDESRDADGSIFPMVDVLNAGSVYTTFGYEPFTPNNELRYNSLQLQDNFTVFLTDHYLTFGVSAERYESENVFFPGSQSAYVYDSLQAFYNDANGYIANPNRDSSNVRLNLFQVRWSNQPGMEKPIQPLEVYYTGIYGQDEWKIADNFKLTAGLRFDVPFFKATGFANAEASGMYFRDENGNSVQYNTEKLPDANILFSPRAGFNWDAWGDQTTQIRGGMGIFTAKPAYVWISNQVGNNGVLTGFESLTNTYRRGFNPDPNHYKPTNVTGAPASSYELAFTDPNFKFPQIWRTNFAIDQKLPLGLIGTAEFMYSKDVNGVYYINANLPAAQTSFSGVDNRPKWTDNTINNKIPNAIVLKNQSLGYAYNVSASLELPYRNGLFGKIAYNYGVSRNTVDPGSIASGSWQSNFISGDPNNPDLGYSIANAGHRVFAALSYRLEYFNFGATTISLFWEGFNLGNASYSFSGDLNGDGARNDLIYIPKNVSEMNFQQYVYNNNTPTITTDDITFTVDQQNAAWEAYIQQDEYLSANRGKYAERGGVVLPMVFRADLSIAQEVFANFLGAKNSLQFRVDVLNVGNLLNKDWGVGQSLVSTTPLIARPSGADGKALYRLTNVGDKLLSKTFQQTSTINDVFRIQLGVRYTFN